MAPTLGSVFPNFFAKTTKGDFFIHDWMQNSWALIFSHPADFTPVCTTELARLANLQEEFDKRGVKIIGLSFDSVENHNSWVNDIKSYASVSSVEYPIIAADRKLAYELGMLDEAELDSTGLPLTARAVFFVGPDLKLKASILYPATSGRNFDEVLRILDSLQLTHNHPYVATPVDWKVSEKVLLQPKFSVNATPYAESEVEYVPFPSGLKYARFVQDPTLK